MKITRKNISEEIQKLVEDKYPMPLEIQNALEVKLKMTPIIRYVDYLKAVNSIPPSYRVFLLSDQYFDIIYEDYSLMIKVGQEEYYLGDVGGANLARKHINRLLKVKPMKTGEDEEDEDTGEPTGRTTPSPPPPSPPPPDEPEEEPEA